MVNAEITEGGEGRTFDIPQPKAPRGFITKIATAQFGVVGALYTPILVTLALRIAQVDPDNEAGSLSIVLATGALFALFANPLFGRLSDRTRSRFGRRRPWMVGGVVAGLIGLTLIAFAQTIPIILIGWVITQCAYNACLSSMQATVADLVPSNQLGKVSGAIGFAQTAPAIVCIPIATLMPGAQLKFLLPALFAVAAVAFFAISLPDRQVSEQRDRFSIKEFIGSLWTNPVEHRDFGWAWICRFLVSFGAMAPPAYLFYYLTADFGLSEDDAVSQVTLLIMVSYVVMAGAALVGGWLSDRIAARKPFLIASSLVQFVGLVVLAAAPDLWTIMLSQVLVGIGGGIFFAVDMAVMTEVLPNKADAAKDLGVMNIAVVLPQVLAPTVAVFILGGTDNYVLFFVVTAVVSLCGTFTVPRIRGIR
ncbi:MFS transporter [Rhodococcus sp. NPDC059968]|uniref:MFS transporter n=1 Tax=Rhodococcus sp. NPDC059968 TaxID=3347017 RepID=UPI00366CA256